MGRAKRLRKAKVQRDKEKNLINHRIQVASNALGISTEEMKKQIDFAAKNKNIIETVYKIMKGWLYGKKSV